MAKGKKEVEVEEEEEEQFEVSKITNHRGVSGGKGKGLEYYLQWKGYGRGDDSWEPESAVDNAPDILKKYWDAQPLSAQLARYPVGSVKYNKIQEKINSPSVNGTKTNGSAKKRKTSPELASPDAKKKKPVSAKKEVEEDEEELKEPAEEEDEEEDTLMMYEVGGRKMVDKHETMYKNAKSWESYVLNVETIERTKGDVLKLLVIWNDDQTYAWVDSDVAKHKCPLKIIDFYEKHLKFRVKEDGEEGDE